MIHRDIKGANILVDDRGCIKLADFGASKILVGGSTLMDENQSLRGTPYFMAPEVIMQTGHGRKADVWSVGCTVLQMVTGRPPWKRKQKFESQAQLMCVARSPSRRASARPHHATPAPPLGIILPTPRTRRRCPTRYPTNCDPS